MSPPRGDGAMLLTQAIGSVVRRQRTDGDVTVALATITDPRPASLSARLAGFTSASQILAADYFDVFPLATGDIVLCIRPPGGQWTAALRLYGSEPELVVDPYDIAGSMVQAGEGVTRDGEDTDSLMQWYRGDVTAFPSGITSVTWTFREKYALPPNVLPSIESETGDGPHLNTYAFVRDVSVAQARFWVRNFDASPNSVRLVALAHGAV